MEKAAKEKFLQTIVPKYKKADRAERSNLLDEIVNKLKIHRKSAIRLLRGYLKPQKKSAKTVKKKTGRRKK